MIILNLTFNFYKQFTISTICTYNIKIYLHKLTENKTYLNLINYQHQLFKFELCGANQTGHLEVGRFTGGRAMSLGREVRLISSRLASFMRLVMVFSSISCNKPRDSCKHFNACRGP